LKKICALSYSFSEAKPLGKTKCSEAKLFLNLTLESLRSSFDDIIIFYRHDNDIENDIDAQWIKLETCAIHEITYESAIRLREYATKNSYDIVYFTEADQILHCTDINKYLEYIEANENLCINPHRFDQLPEIDEEYISKRLSRFDTPESSVVEFDGKLRCYNNRYIVSNTFVNQKFNLYNEDLYYCDTDHEAYGAAYLTSVKLLNKIDYGAQKKNLENGSGRLIFRSGKSTTVKSRNYFDFFVEHLSGYRSNWIIYPFSKEQIGELESSFDEKKKALEI